MQIQRQPDYEVYYCKSLKSTGRPIIVKDLSTGKETNTNVVDLKNVDVRMDFMNSRGKAKSRGATTILQIFKHEGSKVDAI